ncbi:A disintegrin and metalloproteinase with thrombospondin motifs 6-like isoform X2 [Anneissia japonica]|uniref:A disintegrin and metalloproteinase with thrombospondin motifs 6-like isoform X2 n=1 Tax=Anneissia japonica TaxID=1529436 RepID=UPI001425A2B8|nr:A disintegrin and metalloproteinase with thrombospondin motifs 6-like isoform X2 [Anneissia japonica]
MGMNNLQTILIWLCSLVVMVPAGTGLQNEYHYGPMTKTMGHTEYETYETVLPALVNHKGEHISYDILNSRKRTRRHAVPNMFMPIKTDKILYYKFVAQGTHFHLNLTLNEKLFSHNYIVEYRGSSGHVDTTHRQIDDCHYHGSLVGNVSSSKISISNCKGLHGIINSEGEEFLIEPLYHLIDDVTEGFPHAVYKRSTSKSVPSSSFCGVSDSNHKTTKPLPANRNVPERMDAVPSRRKKRSLSTEVYVETLVVADKKMVSHHKVDDVEQYLLTIMNIVSGLYKDESIGNSVNIVVSRLILLVEDQPDLDINHHAEHSLSSFCNWQELNNVENATEDGIAHHDNAVLITRYDICIDLNKPCGTLGLAPVEGICTPSKSCSINEDTGLGTAFTIAHELGHNFGMQHDGHDDDIGSKCGKPGESAKLMAKFFHKDSDPFSWSHCSEEYLTKLLDSGKGDCLLKIPHIVVQSQTEPRREPGEIYNADEQCRLQYGEGASHCRMGKVCSQLYCFVEGRGCITNFLPATEGTKCLLGVDSVTQGWCYQGDCVESGTRPGAVDGQWGEWGAWGPCSRSCDGGISTKERRCDSPRPRHGGNFCLGLRKQYRSCNIDPCPSNSKDFREMQCSAYDNKKFARFPGSKPVYYTWKPYLSRKGRNNNLNVCALNCLAVGTKFFVQRSPQVVDGTRCDKESLDVCINGRCHPVGCDRLLNSNMKMDKCQVCGGDGSTCETISGRVDRAMDHGTYQEIVSIPAGATNIYIQESQMSGSFLALKSANSRKYYINGEWKILWPTSFNIIGTLFKYKRPNDAPESLYAAGPTTKDIVVMLLVQEENHGVEYEYSIPITPNSTAHDDVSFNWRLGQWSECSASCAGGEKVASIECKKSDDESVVSDTFCNPAVKPNVKRQSCNTQRCQPQWSIGDWSECSQTCNGGVKHRLVTCMAQVTVRESESVHESHCMTHKPISELPCGTNVCPPQWVSSVWSKCLPECGPGIQTREVTCMSSNLNINSNTYAVPDNMCDRSQRPASRRSCDNERCPPPRWISGPWSECNGECGRGQRRRSVRCESFNGHVLTRTHCSAHLKPSNYEQCKKVCGPDLTNEPCEDAHQVAYCPLVLKFNFCTRQYFRKMCCRTCLNNSQA